MVVMKQAKQFYKDDLGNPIILGKELARGGEGRICLVQGKDDVVAKLYLDNVLKKHDKSKKIIAMCDLYDDDVAEFSALPQNVIYDAKNNVVGFIMEKITNFREIHNLYGISTKRKLFDYADWGFMVHSAKNLAIAVDKLHSKNIIIGDINQGNILVNNQAMIKLIDCDSYQVEYNGKFYLCEVGVPEYTSPELQGQSFDNIKRTKNHDCFGLAVMIFQILMFGRHPYSGVGAPPEIENSIKQGCYCYGNYSKSTTPIYSQLFSEILSEEVKNLFERAFAKGKNIVRPTAEEWINTLDCLEQNLIQCPNNHKYYNNANTCVWCELSKYGFNPFEKSSINTKPQNKPNYQQTPYLYTPKKQNSISKPSPNHNNFSKSSQAKNAVKKVNPFVNNLKATFIIVGILLLFGLIGSLYEPDNSNYNSQLTTQETQEQPLYDTQNQNLENEKVEVARPTKVEKQKNLSEAKDRNITKNTKDRLSNKYNDPNVYLSQIKQILQNNLQTNYSMDCTILYNPLGGTKIIDDKWNGDTAYNFIMMNEHKFPKFVDANGKEIPLIIKFSGHSIASVQFQYAPKIKQSDQSSERATVHSTKQSTNKSPSINNNSKSSVNVQINEPKTDLQKSSDDFFE